MEPVSPSLKAGTFSGTLLVVIIQINTEELVKTAVLAMVGAVVSFLVTMALRWMVRRVRKRGW